MFYKIGRLFTNCRIIQLQKCRTLNVHYTRTNTDMLLSNFVRLRKDQVRQRSIFQLISKPTTKELKKHDNVPDLFQLIYRNRMGRYLIAAQIASTIFTGFVCISLIINTRDAYEFKLSEDAWKVDVGYISNEMYVYLTALIGFCIILQLMVAKMPIRIYNYTKQKEYIMIFYGALPGTSKRVTFNACEIMKLEELGGLLPWGDSTYKIKDNGNVILMENCFRTPADLNIMLGYQKNSEEDNE